MRFGSVCSGIEAASVAWHPLGWQAAWLSEIEPFPCQVLKHHYPDVPNLGDMTKLPDRIRSGEVEAPDLFCGGTPCQAFSVAGLRKSLEDVRGNLSLTFCEIADAIDSIRSIRGLPATIVFWENVPGVLSTKDNAFGCFLAQLCGGDEPLVAPDSWSDAVCVDGLKRTVAWRVLDAQYFGVAQRRKRVFVVASARDGFDPAAVLFEFDGLRRDTAPSREKGQGIATGAKAGAGESRADRTLIGLQDCSTFNSEVAGTIVTREGVVADTAHMVMQPTYAIQGAGHTSQNSQGSGWNEEFSFTLNCMDVHGVVAPTLTASNDPSRSPQSSEITAQVAAVVQATAVAFNIAPGKGALKDDIHVTPGDVTKTIDASGSNPAMHQGGSAVLHAMQVRRLTPVECERLQGFPDGYTNIPWRGKSESPDGPRYKALEIGRAHV